MAFCSNCGAKLINGVKFCSECGAKVITQDKSVNRDINQNYQRKTIFEGKVHKCPNCGEILNSFSGICPSCGVEIRNVDSNNSVKELSLRLAEIENKRKKSKIPSLFKMYNPASMVTINEIDEQKINLIKTFPIPNTKEDILEFCILAYSNIDEDSYTNQLRYSSKMVSEAWVSKLEQVYEKALLVCDDIYLKKVDEICQRSKKKIKSSKSIWKNKNKQSIFIVFGAWAVIILILIISLGLARVNDENKNEELKNNPNAISLKYSSDNFKDKNYKDVIRLLKNQGFINFETNEFEKDDEYDEIDEVHSISIDGDDTFYKGDLFLPEDLVVIYYYI